MDEKTSENRIRINKYLSQAGVLSRRKADEAIKNGEITINERVAVNGDMVLPTDEVRYKGERVSAEGIRRVILAYNKPLGLVCTSKESDKESIFRKIDYPDMLYYVGRLDQNSQGLLLLTNDGELANRIQKARNNHEKEYLVRVDKPVTPDFLKGMSAGVPIPVDSIRTNGNGGTGFKTMQGDASEYKGKMRTTKKCKVARVRTGEGFSPDSFKIILTEGINHQIRKMCEHFGYRVTYLKRIRVMNIKLGNLAPGTYRELTPEEENTLRKSL